jgi:cytoskeleton protein RodZ
MNVERSMTDKEIGARSAFEVDQVHPAQHVMSPGAQLAALREERGWTIEQVASQLNLAPRQVAALENDNHPALPGISIVRGFIRAYAKLLKVDPAPLLAMVGGETVFTNQSITPRQTLSAPFSEARLPSMGQQRPGLSSKWILGTLLLLLAGVVLWAARQPGDFTAVPDVISTPVVKDEQESDLDVSAAAQEPASLMNEQHVAALPPAEVALDSTMPEATLAPPVTSMVPALPEPPAARASASPVQESPAPRAGDMLSLEMREESWVEVRRTSNNSVMISRLASAGESVSIEMSEPVSLVIGNAAGVDATLRGEPLELTATTRTNVARLNLK